MRLHPINLESEVKSTPVKKKRLAVLELRAEMKWTVQSDLPRSWQRRMWAVGGPGTVGARQDGGRAARRPTRIWRESDFTHLAASTTT